MPTRAISYAVSKIFTASLRNNFAKSLHVKSILFFVRNLIYLVKMSFKSYQPRKLDFHGIINVNDWQVKIYTFTFQEQFQAKEVLENAIIQLSEWLELTKTLDFETYKIAFLIVHEGRDGIWCILNWWLGENMLRSVTFCTSAAMPKEFVLTPNEGGMVCVWELELLNFERQKWIEHILKKPESPDFSGYLKERLSVEI